jgi:uncharacterized protein YjbI with pentapeptide repeats
MNKCRQLILQLRSFDNQKVLWAVDELRKNGWLEDSTLNGLGLRHAHLDTADLSGACLQRADLSMADMRWTDLSRVDLQDAKLNNTNLYRANMDQVNLTGAYLIRANLQSVSNLGEKALMKANALFGATMPDGSIYDGRFNLPGDLQMARFRKIDLDDVHAMASFYGVSEVNHWLHDTNECLPHCTHTKLIRKLSSFQNEKVGCAIEELRRRGRLSDGSLQGRDLRFAHMQGVDMSAANLTKTNLSFADMRGVNLAYAHLVAARFHKVNFRGANFEKADLQEATLTDAFLQGAQNLGERQLACVSKLRGAMMPDGSRYDGRFNLIDDISDAYTLRVDIEDPEALAAYFGVSAEDYFVGQSWVHDRFPVIWARKEHLHIADVLFALTHSHAASTLDYQSHWR